MLFLVVFFINLADFLCPLHSNLGIGTFACSGPPIQRAPPPSASQNPPPFIGQPYRPGGVVQRLDILNRMA